MAAPPTKPWYTDWTQYLCPGPTRVFTPEEMARAGDQPWPKGVSEYVMVSVALLWVINGPVIEWRMMWGLVPGTLMLAALALLGAQRLWRQPQRRRLNLYSFSATALTLVLCFALRHWLGRSTATLVMAGAALSMLVLAVSAWWFLVIHRVAQIEARLRELGDQAEQQRLIHRLATAQIHPHFVFNTLASLTHWVETQDPRAAPLLHDFNAYLRATLPMFEREHQPLREELELVRRYLAIMQARLGERLQWQVEHDAQLDEQPVPPGSLLTLVENAVTHGIEPSLRGGRIEVHTEPGRLIVRNTGEPFDPSHPEGLGLSNTRQRLAAQGASLHLRALNPGCEATIRP